MVKRPGAGPGDASGSRSVERRDQASQVVAPSVGLREQELPSYGASVVVRAGAHILTSASHAAHRHLYPDARARSRAIGVWAATSGFALAAGPVVGGVLTGVWSWRGIFWFNLAFGLAVLIVAAIILPESADDDRGVGAGRTLDGQGRAALVH
jgi:MFS family permease